MASELDVKHLLIVIFIMTTADRLFNFYFSASIHLTVFYISQIIAAFQRARYYCDNHKECDGDRSSSHIIFLGQMFSVN